jgi:hypothetical protein
LVAISCITDKYTNPEEIKIGNLRKVFQIFQKQLSFWDSQLFLITLFILYYIIITFYTKHSPLIFSLTFLLIPIYILFFYEHFYTRKILATDIKQFQLSCSPSEGMIMLFKLSFNNDNEHEKIRVQIEDVIEGLPIYHHGGIVNFLKSSKYSLKNSTTLVCMSCTTIRKFNIKLNKNISILEEGTYLLPENLFKKLENFKDSRRNWKYLLKSRFQEYLMVDTNNHQKINIEIYDINNLQLVNVFYRHNEENISFSNGSEPGIFAISTDSRLFAYSYGDNIITVYLMESGLEVVSKRFDDIYKIKFLEFIENNKKLFIIEEDEENDVKFHIWIISGCLNDYFSISKDDIGLSDNDISTLSKYDEHYYTLTKANGKVVYHNKDNKDHFRVVHKVTINRTTFGENDTMTDEHEYMSRDLEPWKIVQLLFVVDFLITIESFSL